MSHDDTSPLDAAPPRAEQEVLLAEYQALRPEILRRIDVRYQLLAVAIVAPGTLLAVALQTRNISLTLLYPLFAYFLALAWSDNERSIRQLGEYIRTRIEARLLYMQWQHVLLKAQQAQSLWGRWLNYQSARGIFLGTQLASILVGLTLVKPGQTGLGTLARVTQLDLGFLVDVRFLLALSAASTIGTLVTLRRRRIWNMPPLGEPSSQEPRAAVRT